MHPDLKQALDLAIHQQPVPSTISQLAFEVILNGQASEVEIAALLVALVTKGEAVSELVGAAQAMRTHATKIPVASHQLLDTCGTGGDGLHTFNISTATAIVAAACGVKVAKHGNRSVSSSTGSADVLEALGVKVDLTPEQVANCIDQIGIGFCFAPLLHAAMKHAVPVRKALGIRTLFNLIGPLTNPAGAQYQLLGAARNHFAEKIANTLLNLGTERALVVCGNDEIDEVCLWGPTAVFQISADEQGKPALQKQTWMPKDFGLEAIDVNDLRVGSAAESAQMIRDVFANQPGPARSIVVANAAAALLTAGKADTLSECVTIVDQALSSGAVESQLQRLVEATQTP